MALFKCKMCGGDLTVSEGTGIIECEYCGTNQTVPSSKDENLHGLYNRANTLRMKAEFDKAEELYEKILQADETQSEAYWGLILCRYGIEYVEDPKQFKRVPTCHRASFDSVVADADYKAALQYADVLQKSIYEKEAKEIDRLQKEILDLSSREEPYDVFICYKETNEAGIRTQDSVIANDIYYQLTNEGFKVFYAAITLEDKLGSAYEPCIFAALNSAKVMLVIGTKPEYFNAVWVKNEWSRFLKIMKKDRSKLLIPCYKEMDAYELPEEFAHLQAQDMGKIGFINDVVRGIKKVISKENIKTSATASANAATNTTAESLLKRAFIFLEDANWLSANEYCEKVLDINPECAEAYLGKLMAELHIRKSEQLAGLHESFENNANYSKIIRYADDALCDFLKDCIKQITQKEIANKYDEANRILHTADSIEDCRKAILILTEIIDYQDSKLKIEECEKLIEKFKIDEENLRLEQQEKAAQDKINATIRRKKLRKKLITILSSVVTVCLTVAFVFTSFNFKPWKDIKAIHTCRYSGNDYYYLRDDGTVISDKQRDWTSEWTDIIAIESCGACVVGLKSDGTVVIDGADDYVEWFNVSNWTDIVEISMLEGHIVGLKSDGTVVATGENEDGQCDVSEWKDIVAIEAGHCHTVGVKSDGTIVFAGEDFNTRYDISDWKNIKLVLEKGNHIVGLKTDGTVVEKNTSLVTEEDDDLCDVSDWTDIIAVDVGENYIVGLKSDGTVVATGTNKYGQCDVSTWSGIVEVSVCDRITVGLKSDGTVVATGKIDNHCDNISGWSDIVSISTNGDTITGLKSDGTIVKNDGYAGGIWKGFFGIVFN